jgi:hypothetical protein
MKKSILYVLSGIILMSQTACFGSFGLVKTLYEWNDGVSDNKFVKSIITWAMIVIPVYGLAGFLDFVIFNLIEFWSGSNPVAMQEGEVETQQATLNGKDYLITATKNQFKFEEITEQGTKEIGIMRYEPSTKVWSYLKGDAVLDLVKVEGDELTYFTKQGELKVPTSTVVPSNWQELAAN